MKYDFPKLCRIRKTWEYQRLWKMGCKLHTPHFILLVTRNDINISRLGLTVSRKVGNAVQRNRVKRHIREFFRLTDDRFISVDLSVIAKRGAAALSSSVIRSELKNALESKGYLSD